MKKTIKDVDVLDKRTLVRVGLAGPLEHWTAADRTRVRSALPTIEYLVGERARVILCTDSGQTVGEPADASSLEPLRDRLSELLQSEVRTVDDCVGSEVRRAVDDLQPGEVLLLGSTELYAGERMNNPIFASELASIADLYVNDDFATAHLSHASTEGVARHLPAVAGLSFSRQLEGLQKVQEHPERPLVAILGGAAFPDRIGLIEHLLRQVDGLLVGGNIAMTFLRAAGLDTGPSLAVGRQQEAGQRLMRQAGEMLVMPVDVVVGDDLAADSESRTVPVQEVRSDSYVRDIGPRSIELFQQKLADARTVVWYGSLGAPELAPTSHANLQIARTLAGLDAQSIVGGKDAVAAAEQAEVAERLTIASTGDETFLALLADRRDLPGVRVLEDKNGSSPRAR
jgi:phosphoglycerate kinase